MVAVMNLMVGGTAKEIHERARPFEPDVRVSKVVSQTVVRKNEYPHPEYTVGSEGTYPSTAETLAATNPVHAPRPAA